MTDSVDRAQDSSGARTYAWNYFKLHADQRLQTFHFFITLETAILGAWILLLRSDILHKWFCLPGFFVTFLSFVFWKLDVRTRSLVKNGEEALKYLDQQASLCQSGESPHCLELFARDDLFTKNAQRFPLTTGHFSYSRCFKYIFVGTALVGFAGAIACLAYLPK